MDQIRFTVIMLNGGPVMWKSRIQGANSMSTAESEVRALSYATAQVKWLVSGPPPILPPECG